MVLSSPSHSLWGRSILHCTPSTTVQKTPMNTICDNLFYFWAAPPHTLLLNHPQVPMASTQRCCPFRMRLHLHTHKYSLIAEDSTLLPKTGPGAPSPSLSSSEHISMSALQQNIEELNLQTILIHLHSPILNVTGKKYFKVKFAQLIRVWYWELGNQSWWNKELFFLIFLYI